MCSAPGCAQHRDVPAPGCAPQPGGCCSHQPVGCIFLSALSKRLEGAQSRAMNSYSQSRRWSLSSSHPRVLDTPQKTSQPLLGEEEHSLSCGTARCFPGFFSPSLLVVPNFSLMISSIYRLWLKDAFPRKLVAAPGPPGTTSSIPVSL